MTSHERTTSLPIPLPPTPALFSRVVLGIDFHSASLAAARWATANVAVRTQALLSHVVPFPDHSPADEDEEAVQTEVLRQVTPALAGGLGGFAATLDVASTRSNLRVGSPSRWLSVVADRAEASLIVLGRRADANRRRVGEPNVIERAARRTRASVLVVPEGKTQPLARVVAAVDESAFAPRVLAVARHLARVHEVPMLVLHVLSSADRAYERTRRTSPPPADIGRTFGVVRRQVSPSALRSRTAQWLTRLDQSHIVLGRDRTEVAVGDPAREIIAAAAPIPGSLVVVGMRGADEAPAGSLGSVVRELLTRAPLPVLAVNEL